MGRVDIDRFARRGGLGPVEERLAEWVEQRPADLSVIFSTVYPGPGDDDFDPFDTASICVEERLPDGRIAVQCYDTPTEYGWSEQWEHLEMMARRRLKDIVKENT